MKEGWEYKKLGEVTTKICDGSHNPPKGVEHSEYPMLSSKNIFFDRFDYNSPRYLSEGDFTEENKRTNISDGDVLLTIVGTVGRTCCVTKPFIPFTLQRSVAVLKPQKTIITSRFLMYSLHSLSNIWESEAKGVAQKGVYLKQVSNISIPIPTITEQNDIVCELDLLSGVIEKQKAQLEELDKLAQSIFYDMFGDPVTNEKGWEVKKIKDICKVITGNTPSRNNLEYYNEEYIEWIKTDNILRDSLYPSLAKEYLSEEGAKQGRIADVGSILIACIAGSLDSISKCCLLNRKVSFNQQINALVPKEDMNSLFVYSLVNAIADYIRENTTNGMKHIITKSVLEEIRICVPPLSLQQEFAAKVEAIEAMKAKVRQSLKEAETLFNERMDYYFN